MLNVNLKELAKSINDANITEIKESRDKDIAIIGIAVKLPLAQDKDEFWDNLKDGKDCITDLPRERKSESDVYFKFKGLNPKNIKYKKGSYFEKLYEFDNLFFNISPREASLMDPNQRMFLEIAWSAIEDAGISPGKLRGSRTGVYCGFVSDLAYQRFIAEVEPASIGMSIPGNMAAIIPGRVSYSLDLKGPSILIDTACSSSLVAIHTACCAMRNGDCDLAIAGSTKMSLLPLEDENMLGIESKNYTCKAFDDDADGTCMGEGIMAVVLKPLSRAIKDRDNIYAVIKGTAVNQDGSSIGITAPNVLAQAELIENAWRDAGIAPDTVTFIETHGTGTKLGDPIEIDGISRAFVKYTDKKQFCAVGSVKTNLGHLDSAAGMVGLIKAILALKNKQIPPSINFNKPNRNIDFKNSPVYVNDRLITWESPESPRRCGVSAFGLSGTNCHLVLEEAPVIKKSENTMNADHDKNVNSSVQILALSAKNGVSLKYTVERYAVFLKKNPEISLENLCFMANTGRDHYQYRLAIIAASIGELKEKMQYLSANGFTAPVEQARGRGIYYNEFIMPANVKNYEISEAEYKKITVLAKDKLQELESNRKNISLWNEIGAFYVSGAGVDWDELYRGGDYRKISLPTYPFERRRCWIEIPAVTRGFNETQAEYSVNKGDAAGPIKNKLLFTEKAEITLTGGKKEQYTEIEKNVARIWGEILGFEKFDINDDFYELGGDSVIAMRIVNSINLKMNKNITIPELLSSRTIKELAACIENEAPGQNDAGPVLPPLIPLKEQASYELSSAQKRIFLIEQFNNAGASYNIPIAVTIEGPIDRERLENVFRKLIVRHEALRTSFTFAANEMAQIIHPAVDFKIEYMETNENELKGVINSLVRPFDLAKAPLLRVALVKTAAGKHILFYDLHHIISDGVSQYILLKEFKQLYQAEELPGLNIQYKDYAVWHNRLLETEMMKKQEKYWVDKFTGEIPVLEMPLDYKRPDTQKFTGSFIEFAIPGAMIDRLTDLGKRQGITLNAVLVSLYAMLLSKYSENREVVIGSLVAGRMRQELENVMGVFVNFIPVKFEINDESPLADYLRKAGAMILEAYENQDYPFDKIVEKVAVRLDKTRNPLFDTVFIFHNELRIDDNIEIEGLKFSRFELDLTSSKLDFKIDAYLNEDGGLRCVLEYNTSLFMKDTIEGFIRHFNLLLSKALQGPEQIIAGINLFTNDEKRLLEEKRDRNAKPPQSTRLAVSATFTSEPVEDYIVWWCKQFNIDIEVSFAPYNQVFQGLLDPGSLLMTNDGLNILLVRFEDWLRNDEARAAESEQYAKLEENFEKLTQALQQRTFNIPCFVGVFPVSTHLALSKGMINYLRNMNKRWRETLNNYNNVHVIDFTDLDKLYGIHEVFDPKKDKEGHLPFSDEFYAAMGTFIARKICASKRQRFKVAVLDCDNTLWRGICGEDGELGIVIDKNYGALQKFMLEKYNSGMLLAICSKNNEQDVWHVFEKNPGMILKKENFVSWRINWQSKPENIKSLARELNLGLDSFIFIDDNPVECCQVMEECPAVLTVQLPHQANQIPVFLEHMWAFDIFKVTEEDKNRTKMYLTEKKRQEIQEQKLSLDDFIKSLELKLSFNLMHKSQLGRVAQLTQRTNQFNLSTIRRTEDELESLLNETGVKCWVVEVEDRFGDYGLVGVVITKEEGTGALFLDTFLLSCRVLGRGVENAILFNIGRYCRETGGAYLEAKFYPTSKNRPFLEFMERTGWDLAEKAPDCVVYRLPVDKIPAHDDNIACFYKSKYPKEKPPAESQTHSYVLDHIAMAVLDIEKAREDYLKQGFECGEIVHDPLQNAYLSMCSKDGYDNIELVAPVNSDSPVHRILKENTAGIPYHLCYMVEDQQKFLADLTAKGIDYEIISDAKEAVLFNNNKVTFTRIRNLGLIELLECKETRRKDSENKIKSTVLQIIVSVPEEPAVFLILLGYIQEKSILDVSKKRRLITFFKPGAGKIELVVPTDKDTGEYEFFLKYGAHPFNLYFENDADEQVSFEENTWEVKLANAENLLYRNYLLTLENHAGHKLLKLPVYQILNKKAARTEYKAPTNPWEEKMARIWQEILGLEKIGINDSFFELGGHSLKAATLVSRISKEFNVELSLTDTFKSPTIKMLVEHIRSSGLKVHRRIEPATEKEYYSLSSAQKRVYLLNCMEGVGIAYNQPLAMVIEGALDREKLEETFEKLIQRHEALRTSFAFINDEPVQKIHKEVEFKVQYSMIPAEDKEAAVSGLIKDFIAPFDLGKAPLLKVGLIELQNGKHILICDMHHIISDGISMAILIKEFVNLYSGGELPELRIQYKDYAAWQKQLFETDVLQKQQEYWLSRFSGNSAPAPTVLKLPTDYPRPTIQSFEGDHLSFEAGQELTEGLNRLAKETGTTLYIVLMAVYNVLLSKYTGQEDIIVGSPITGRPHADLQNIIGMFVNTLAMRNYPEGSKTFAQFLEEVKENSLQAYENQDYQFEELVETLGIPRDLSRNPLIDTVFVSFNFDIPEMRIAGLRFSWYQLPNKIAKFDLTLQFQERGETIDFGLEYCNRLFKKETIERVGKDFLRIIEYVVKDREIKINKIKLVENYAKHEKAIKEEVIFDF